MVVRIDGDGSTQQARKWALDMLNKVNTYIDYTLAHLKPELAAIEARNKPRAAAHTPSNVGSNWPPAWLRRIFGS